MHRSRHRFVVLAVAAVALAAASLAALAPARAASPQIMTKLSPAGGWPTDNYAAHYSAEVTGEMFGGAAVGDLDGNGVQDMVAGFEDGTVTVIPNLPLMRRSLVVICVV